MTFLECFGLLLLIGFNVSALVWLITERITGCTKDASMIASLAFLLTAVLFITIQIFGG